jgi:hypothetical protein
VPRWLHCHSTRYRGNIISVTGAFCAVNEARRIPALYLRLGATPCGVTKKCCAFFRPKVVCGLEAGELRVQAGGGPDQGARIRGSSAHMPGFLSPRHPPSTRARSAAETNGRDNTQLDARRSCPARGVICERVRAPADQDMWRRPVIRERAAGVRLRLRAFCALWDAARHQSWFKAETMDALV